MSSYRRGPHGSAPPVAPGSGQGVEADASAREVAAAYHERTKHHFHRFAASLGYMDWATQPDPFRRYAGAPLVRLPLPEAGRAVPYRQLYAIDGVPPEPLSLDSVSLFFRYSLSLTAWKRYGETRWSLRANPSSGNRHPTEGYAILPPIVGLGEAPALYHYAPAVHAVERRAILDTKRWNEALASFPRGSFLVGLSSVMWREAWKYGERAFRYCQHDIGHALCALRIAAAALGWSLVLLDGLGSDTLARFFGLDRDEDFRGAEREEAELLAAVAPAFPAGVPPALHAVSGDGVIWQGRANSLSREHAVAWPFIDTVARATRSSREERIDEEWSGFPTQEDLVETSGQPGLLSAEQAIIGRRSAVAMNGRTAIPRAVLFRMLARLIPTRERRAMPWDAIPWRPRIHLALFVHRVDSLAPGLYALLRDPDRSEIFKDAMHPNFRWERVSACPPGLPFYFLEEGDCRALAARLSCGQDIAGDGAFSLGMIADYSDSLRTYGAAFYRNLYWEAGMVGQVLYLEAEEAGIRSTGIGCYFDDPVREILGIRSMAWQSLYHFTVGGPIEDRRLTTLPGYGWDPER